MKTPLMDKKEGEINESLEVYLQEKLEYNSITSVAKELGISLQTLCEWLQKLDIKPNKRTSNQIPLKEILEELYLNGASQQKIARKFNVHQATVSKWFRLRGIKTEFKGKSNLTNVNSGTRNPGELVLVKLYYGQSLSQREIAKKYGVKQITVYRWLKKEGIKPRQRTTAQTIKRGIGVIKPPEEFLSDLYINQQKSAFEIAKLFQVDNSTATDWLKEAGISLREPLFGRKGYIHCNDGHVVRSQKERNICEWLSKNKISHIYEPKMELIKKKFSVPNTVIKRRFLPDFLVENILIEVWALDKKLSYDYITDIYQKKMSEKRELYNKLRKYGVSFIEVYANDDIFYKLGILLRYSKTQTKLK